MLDLDYLMFMSFRKDQRLVICRLGSANDDRWDLASDHFDHLVINKILRITITYSIGSGVAKSVRGGGSIPLFSPNYDHCPWSKDCLSNPKIVSVFPNASSSRMQPPELCHVIVCFDCDCGCVR